MRGLRDCRNAWHKDRKKVTICDFGSGDWCFVIVDGEVYFHGHLSDFQYEVVHHLKALGVENGIDLSEELIPE